MITADGGVSEMRLLQEGSALIFVDLDASANAATINLLDTAAGAQLRRWPLPAYDCKITINQENLRSHFLF